VTFSNGKASLLAFTCQSTDSRVFVTDQYDKLRPPTVVAGDARSLTFVDRKTLALGGAPELRVLGLDDGRLHAFAGHAARISSVTSAPERALIFSADEAGELRVWERAPGTGEVWSSRLLRSASSRGVKRLDWNAGGNLEVEEFDSSGPRPSVLELRLEGMGILQIVPKFSSDELGSSCEGEHPLGRRSSSTVRSTDGLIFAYTTEENDIVVSDEKSGSCLGPLPGHTHNVLALALRADGLALASAGAIADADDSHGVILWDLTQVHPLAHLLRAAGGSYSSTRAKLALSVDGLSWACGNCGENVIWDGASVVLPPRFRVLPVASIALAPERRELAIAFAGGWVIRVVRPGGAMRLESQRQGPTPIERLWYAGRELYVLTENGAIARWNHGSADLVATGGRERSEGSCSDIYSSGAALALETSAKSGLRLISVRDLVTGTTKQLSLPQGAGTCSSLAYAGEPAVGVRLPVGYEPMLILSPRSAAGVTSWVNPIRASSGLRTVLDLVRIADDGRRMVARSDRSAVVVFDLSLRRLIGVLDLRGLEAIALSGQGKRLLTASDSGLLAWDLDPEIWAETAIKISGGPEPSPTR